MARLQDEHERLRLREYYDRVLTVARQHGLLERINRVPMSYWHEEYYRRTSPRDAVESLMELWSNPSDDDELEDALLDLDAGQSARYLGYLIEVTDIGTVLLDGVPMDDLEGAMNAARAWRRQEEYEGYCESQEARRKAEYEGEYEENARRMMSYADWLHAVDEACGCVPDAPARWWRQLYNAGLSPAQAVQETQSDQEFEPNRAWSSRMKHSLPASSFLYHHGDVRKLPFKDAQGRVSCSHLRNALARLSHTDIPESMKPTIRRRAEELLARHCGR